MRRWRRDSAMIFSAWIWNRLAEETGPIGKGPLGPSKPRRGPRPPAPQDPPPPPPPPARPHTRGASHHHPLPVGLRQPDRLDRLDRLGRRRPAPLAMDQVGHQALELIEVDRRHLRRQPRAPVGAQIAPPPQQVALSMSFQ